MIQKLLKTICEAVMSENQTTLSDDCHCYQFIPRSDCPYHLQTTLEDTAVGVIDLTEAGRTAGQVQAYALAIAHWPEDRKCTHEWDPIDPTTCDIGWWYCFVVYCYNEMLSKESSNAT